MTREFDVSEPEGEPQTLSDTNVQAGLLLAPSVGEEVDEAVRHRALAAVLGPREVLEPVGHALDDGPLAQHDPVEERHQPVLHPPLELRLVESTNETPERRPLRLCR